MEETKKKKFHKIIREALKFLTYIYEKNCKGWINSDEMQ